MNKWEQEEQYNRERRAMYAQLDENKRHNRVQEEYLENLEYAQIGAEYDAWQRQEDARQRREDARQRREDEEEIQSLIAHYYKTLDTSEMGDNQSYYLALDYAKTEQSNRKYQETLRGNAFEYFNRHSASQRGIKIIRKLGHTEDSSGDKQD